MTPDQWIAALQPYGLQKTGLDTYRARCPGHDGQDKNLAVRVMPDGRVLTTCHSHQCSHEAIREALFGKPDCQVNGAVDVKNNPLIPSGGKGVPVSDPYIESPETRNRPNPKKGSIDWDHPEDIWHYCNAAGKGLFNVYRFKTADNKGKTYRIRRLSDGARARPPGVLPVYNLPKVLAHDLSQTVLVVEGEKCADTWNEATNGEELATTWAMGAANWRQTDWSWTDGRNLHIVADADDTSRTALHKLAEFLIAEHDPVSVKLTCPDGNDHKDIHDIITAEGMEAARGHLENTAIQVNVELEGGLRTVGMDVFLSMPEKEIEWLVHDLLIRGGLSLLTAKPKVGKSTFARCLAVAVAQGCSCLGRDAQQGPVLYLAHEEKQSEVLRHFRQLGAHSDDPIQVFVKPAPKDAVDQLRCSIRAHRPALVVIDPIFRFLKKIKDGNDYVEMTHALEPLMTMARRYDTHILVTHHSNKAGGSEGDEVLGSTALFGGGN